METLAVVSQHRNQYYSRVQPCEPLRFGSSPSGNYREINCRTFHSGDGILPTPLKACSTPLTKRSSYHSSPSSPSSSSSSPKTPSPKADSPFRNVVKSSPIPIKRSNTESKNFFTEEPLYGSRCFSFSELWAGPAYSNSPPPSSLPIPNFSIRPKRSVSLGIPASEPVVERDPIVKWAKSAPSSPTREYRISEREISLCADSATKNLRRILNLDSADE